MEDSDSGVASMSSGHGASSSIGGDDRSGAGSRSSAASLALSEVSSPAPTQQAQNFSTSGQQQQPLALTVPRSSSVEPVRVWRDPQLLESGPVVRHIHSLQHHALMMAPGGGAAVAAGPTDPAVAAAYSNLASAAAAAAHLPLLLPPTSPSSDMWPGQQQHCDEEKSTYRDRTSTGRLLRDMERGKDVDRERMVHHIQQQQQQQQQRADRERDADREAEQAVDKHFEESLKKYKHSQMPWSINTIPAPHSLSATSAGASPPPLPRSSSGVPPGSAIPSLSISSIPPTSSSSNSSGVGMTSLNISPSTNNNANKKGGFVKTSGANSGQTVGNISKGSDSGIGGHVIDHHAPRSGGSGGGGRGPTTDVIGLSARNGVGGGGSVTMSHYDPYLPPPPSAASQHQMMAAAAAAEEHGRRVRMERDRIIMDREMEQAAGDQMRMQQNRQRAEREKEIERIRHMEQQQRSYYGNAAAAMAAAAAATTVHRAPPSSSSAGPGSTNGSNKSTSSISVIPTSSPVSSVHSNGSNPSAVSIDYAHHRGLTISPSMKQHMDKQQPQGPPQGHQIYAYPQHLYQPMVYHKDAKGKPEMSLPAPPPLLSDVKSSGGGGGVIVKHDTGPMKQQPMSSTSVQVIPTSSLGSGNNKSTSHSPSPNQYKSVPGPGQPPLLFEYRHPTGGQPNIVSIHAAPRDPSPQSHQHQQQQQQQQMVYADRYKMQPYPGSHQSPASQRQSPASMSSYQRQALSPKQMPPGDNGNYGQSSQSGKPKVSSPAPAHIYGKPESGPQNSSIGSNNIGSAGIVTGIPVSRTSSNSNYPPVHTSVHLVQKPNSSSSPSSSISLESQRSSSSGSASSYPPPGPQRIYGNSSGPPPAHSRIFEAPATSWPYAGGGGSQPTHSSLLHSLPPVSISINPPLNRSPGGATNALQVPGQLGPHVSNVNSISISTSSVVMSAHHPHVPDVQTQPLDLGTSDRSRDSMHSNNSSESKSPPMSASVTMSLKRKSNTPIHYNQSPLVGGMSAGQAQAAAASKDMKKKRYDALPQPQHQQQHHQQQQHSQQMHQHPQQHGSYFSPHQVQANQYSIGQVGGPQQQQHYSVYQNVVSQSGSVAIHPIPGPYIQSIPGGGGRKEITPMVNTTHNQPPISVVVSIANHHENSQSPMKHQVPIQIKSEPTTRDHLPKGPTQSNNSMMINQAQPPAMTVIKTKEEVEEKPKPIFSANPIPVTEIKTSPSTTPIKLPEQIKTESPVATPKTMSSGPRNLKKAWLQRHTGEDANDQSSTVVVASVTVPQPVFESAKPSALNKGNGLNNSEIVVAAEPTQSSPIKSISAVGSMAVNSVVKSAVVAGESPSNGNKLLQHPKKGASGGNSLDKSASLAIYSDSDEKEESSSSDQEHAIKSPPKKKQAKTKRKKGGGRKPIAKKKRGAPSTATTASTASAVTDSDKNSDSDKDSASDKDSDSGTSTSQGKHTAGSRPSNGSFGTSSPGPGSSKSDVKERRKRGRRPKVTKEEPLKKKQSKQDQANAQADEKSLASKLKKSGKTYPQSVACHELSDRVSRCRECRLPPDQRIKAFCRFYAFRRLRVNKNGQLAVAGFPDPIKDPVAQDMQLWNPNRKTPPTNMDLETAKSILSNILRYFCPLLANEMNALRENVGRKYAWKNFVAGMREMCDVCETTLFNLHWSCNKCGFAVCLECCKSRRDGTVKLRSETSKDCDDYRWLLCTNGSAHDPERLTATQIMTEKALTMMNKELHDLCNIYGIDLRRCCYTAATVPRELTKVAERIVNSARALGIPDDNEEDSLSVLADVALLGRSDRANPSGMYPIYDYEVMKACRKTVRSYLFRIDQTESEAKRIFEEEMLANPPSPPSPLNPQKTKEQYPHIPHSWLCDGKLLRLHDPRNKDNCKLFLNLWKFGQPVLVSNVTRKLTRNLWTPESFSADFGHQKHDLVNCINGDVISNMPMRKFWDGFDTSKRLKDDKGQPMLLKLKDWPPDENFETMLPERFEDLMDALPLPEYTHRNGKFNLAGRLPGCFVRPDLGPKMYNAYGSALHPTKGTTNLHMDISDAVNVMVYVGIPKGVHTEETKEAFRAIDEAGCDILTRRRVRDKNVVPGALWHIYAPCDADKIRKLLREVALERGEIIEDDSDPIHDQSWYLDGPLRERLYKSYGVEGYPIAQCLGDAIFIPAGAPHQVRNLHNCIKVAEDFVSPENIGNCIKLTDEFRQLSDSHQNREDKLQIKNIMYHAAKDCLAYLYHRLEKEARNWQSMVK